jgi:hypothetical protein
MGTQGDRKSPPGCGWLWGLAQPPPARGEWHRPPPRAVTRAVPCLLGPELDCPEGSQTGRPGLGSGIWDLGTVQQT